MFLIEFLFIVIVVYYLGKMLWGLFLTGALKRQQEMMDAMRRSRTSSDSPEDRGSPAKPIVIGEMVACARCGTYVARNQAVEKSGKLFCCEACAG